MELNLVHFYPDLMNLYGSYANVSALKRALEAMGNTVTVQVVLPGETADLSGADFLFMGAGTERAQLFVLKDFLKYEEQIKAAANAGVTQLYCGTAMELLGRSITDAQGRVYNSLELANFTSVQSKKRLVEDVYGHTALYEAPVVGFLNTCTTISGVSTPLLNSVELGWGNEGSKTPEGYHWKNVFASRLTGPILVKNPRLLDAVITAIYQHREVPLPESLPKDTWAENGYAITAEQLKLRMEAK